MADWLCLQLPSVNETRLTYVARTILTAHTLDTIEDQRNCVLVERKAVCLQSAE